MKILTWETAKNEGAREALDKMQEEINKLPIELVELLTPLTDLIQEIKQKYK